VRKTAKLLLIGHQIALDTFGKYGKSIALKGKELFKMPPDILSSLRILDHFVTVMKRAMRKSAVSFDRPVFIWGFGQSGTYLLYDLLAFTDQFAYPWITNSRKKGLVAGNKYGSSQVNFDRVPHEGTLIAWSGVRVVFEKDNDWLFDHVMTEVEAGAIDMESVRNRYAGLHTTLRFMNSRKRRLLDKSPNYIFMISAIERIFPDALHIFCLRDPRMILSSVMKRYKVRDYEKQTRPSSNYPYANILIKGWESYMDKSLEEQAARQIVEVLKIGFEAKRKLGNRCLCSYHESLLNSPKAELERIYSFVGINVSEKVSAILGSLKAPTAGRWPEEAADLYIDPATLSSIENLISLTRDLGYDNNYTGVIKV
jgi:hypothetical protein